MKTGQPSIVKHVVEENKEIFGNWAERKLVRVANGYVVETKGFLYQFNFKSENLYELTDYSANKEIKKNKCCSQTVTAQYKELDPQMKVKPIINNFETNETNDTNNMLLLYLIARSDKMDTKTMLMASMMSGGKMDMNSMLPLFLLDKSGGGTDNKMDDLLPFLMMSGTGGGKGMENMLPLLLLSDSGSKDDLLPFLLMSGGQVDENLMTMLTLDPARVKEFLMVSMILKNESLKAKVKRLFIQKFAKDLTDHEKQELSGNNFSSFLALRYDFTIDPAKPVATLSDI